MYMLLWGTWLRLKKSNNKILAKPCSCSDTKSLCRTVRCLLSAVVADNAVVVVVIAVHTDALNH